MNPPTIFGAFGALRWLGALTEDSTPRWDACVTFNGVEEAQPPGDTIGSRFVSHSFTRKRFREIMAAQRELEAAAEEVESRKAAKVLAEAARNAKAALEEAELGQATAARLDALERTLKAAVRATTVAKMITEANAANEAAKALMDELEEEHLAMLLLS